VTDLGEPIDHVERERNAFALVEPWRADGVRTAIATPGAQVWQFM
jgi:hypothetical protein